MSKYDYSIFWEETIKQLREENEISVQEFNMYFQNIHYVDSTSTSIVLSLPSRFIQSQIKQRYSSIIEERLLELSGLNLTLDFKIEIKKAKDSETKSVSPVPETEIQEEIRKSHPQLRNELQF